MLFTEPNKDQWLGIKGLIKSKRYMTKKFKSTCMCQFYEFTFSGHFQTKFQVSLTSLEYDYFNY